MKSTLLSLLLPGCALASGLKQVAIHARSVEELREIATNSSYDLGCRPVALPTEDGGFKLHALLTADQHDYLTETLAETSLRVIDIGRGGKRAATAPIGTGDRFKAGTVAPLGLGTRSQGVNYDLGGIMNVAEIKSAVDALVATYGIGKFTTPFTTVEGATSFAGYAGAGTDASKYHIYFSAAVHARERGGPDNIIYFVSDLLYAQKNKLGLTYGKKTYTNAQVNAALNAGIVFFPLVNPDGVAYDQKTSSLWRKNRNTASSRGSSRAIGVDINRNFDFLWDYTKYFSSSEEPASNVPSDETFYGTAPASEAETKNLISIYDKFPNIRWFLDIHSAAGTILYSWGDDDNQSTNPSTNFLNATFNGKRGVVGDTVYKEYIPQQDWDNIKNVAVRTTNAMKAVGGRSYTPQQSVGLYATSGASDDYAFSRHFSNSSLNKVYGYTMEFGYSTNFYPTAAEFQQNIIDTNAGFFDFILGAIEVGLV